MYLELYPNSICFDLASGSSIILILKKLPLYIENVLLPKLGYYLEYCNDHMIDLRYQILPHLVFVLSQEIPSNHDLHMITREKKCWST